MEQLTRFQMSATVAFVATVVGLFLYAFALVG